MVKNVISFLIMLLALGCFPGVGGLAFGAFGLSVSVKDIATVYALVEFFSIAWPWIRNFLLAYFEISKDGEKIRIPAGLYAYGKAATRAGEASFSWVKAQWAKAKSYLDRKVEEAAPVQKHRGVWISLKRENNENKG